MGKGSLYLIPNYLGENPNYNYDLDIIKMIKEINHFIFENEKPRC